MTAEVLREEQDSEHRYRITRTDKGHLLTMRSRKGDAMWMPIEWLHRTLKASNTGLDAIMAFNAVWLAMGAGYPTTDLMRTAEARSKAHNEVCARLNDHPLMRQGVRALRGAAPWAC